jgi:hypothetical protein
MGFRISGAGPLTVKPPPFWQRKIGEPTLILMVLAGLGVASHLALAYGLIHAISPDLEYTLAFCAPIWVILKITVISFIHFELTPALRPHAEMPALGVPSEVEGPGAPPAPTVIPPKDAPRPQIWSGVSDIMIDKPDSISDFPADPPAPILRPPAETFSLAMPGQKIEGPGAPPKRRGPSRNSPGRPPKETTFALEVQIMSVIEMRGEVKTSELVQGLGLNRKAVNRLQEKLLREGRLVRVGKGRNSACRLKDAPARQPKPQKRDNSFWKMFEQMNQKPWGPQKNDPLVIAQCLEDSLLDDMFADYKYPRKLRGDIKEMNYKDTVIWIRLTYKQTYRRIFEKLLPHLVNRPSSVDYTIIHRRMFPFLARYLAQRGFSPADIAFFEKAAHNLAYQFNHSEEWDED